MSIFNSPFFFRYLAKKLVLVCPAAREMSSQLCTALALLALSLLLFPGSSWAQSQPFQFKAGQINDVIQTSVRDGFSYSGLASFYNGISAYVVDAEGELYALDASVVFLKPKQTLAILGHHQILLASDFSAGISFKDEQIFWHPRPAAQADYDNSLITGRLLTKSELSQLSSSYQHLRYAHLWAPFRWLCLAIEQLLIWIHSIHPWGWGVSIIFLSLLFKLFILPANCLLIRSQRQVSQVQAKLAPELRHIKKTYSGEAAHQKFMAVHKQCGVTPFYTLKPLLWTLAPVPFLIAIFNVLGEMDQLTGHSFMWIKDLAYPDAIVDLGFHIPLFGDSINLLPILMTALTIFAAVFHQNNIVTPDALRKQKLNLYFMAFGFFILFYPFPSAMVLYWTLANIWQLIQQRFLRI